MILFIAHNSMSLLSNVPIVKKKRVKKRAKPGEANVSRERNKLTDLKRIHCR